MVKKTKKIKGRINADAHLRISYHEKICSERMKTLFKRIDEMSKDVKSLKEDMARGKGAAAIIIFLGGLIGSVFYFFTK